MNRNTIYLSEAAEPSFKQYIREMLPRLSTPSGEAALQEVRATDRTDAAVASHADLYHCSLGSRIVSGMPAGPSYPENIGFNGVRLGSYFIHNLRYTAPEVRAEAERLGLTPVNVKQGYTKCSLVVVESGCSRQKRPAVITADRGIAKVLAPLPIDMLLIEEGHVRLPGFPYGFLGGASGAIGTDLLFHGNLNLHPNYTQIVEFIQAKGKNPVWFTGFPLTDIGSIITLL